MARTQVNNPLALAAPTLQPRAEPIAVPGGATPPPRGPSDLMQLANAFEKLNPELRGLLRDAAAREEADAMALGEIEGAKAQAAGRMAELDKILKAKVDSGELPWIRLPAARRSASFRAGQDAAQIGMQEELSQLIPKAGYEDPKAFDEAAAKVVQKYSESVGSGDFYARVGFDKASQGVLAGFRHQVSQQRNAELERAAKQQLADDGTEHLHLLATADASTAPAVKAAVKTFLDDARTVLPKSQVNAFFGDAMLKPAVDRLVQEGKFAQARQLVEEMKTLDLTGKGGLYGKTEDGSKAIFALSTLIEERDRASSNEAYRVKAEQEADFQRQGRQEAAQVLFDLKKANNGGPLRTADIPKLLAAARDKITNPIAYETFEKSLRTSFDEDERWRNDEAAAARLLSEVNTLSPDRLDAKAAELEVALEARTISASAYHSARQAIEKNKALFGHIDEQDFNAFNKAVFAVKGPLAMSPLTIDVGDPAAVPLWDKFSDEQQTNVRVATDNFFREQLQQNIRLMSGGDPNQVAGIKAQAWDKASTKAREFAKSAVYAEAKQGIKAETAQKVNAQADAINKARMVFPSRSTWAVVMGSTRDPAEKAGYTVSEKAAKGIKNPGGKSEAFVPRAGPDLQKAIDAQASTPQSEWDVMATPSYFYVTQRRQDARKLPRVLDLEELAKEVNATGTNNDTVGNPGRVAAARAYYGIAKSMLGFTPEEIKAGKTKHGVAFNPAEIDYKSIPVFRSVAELEKAWNKGDFTPLFGELGDTLDPKHTMHPEDFYKAQLALLSNRR